MKHYLIALVLIASHSFADTSKMIDASISNGDVEARIVEANHGKQAVVFDDDSVQTTKTSMGSLTKVSPAIGIEVDRIILKDTVVLRNTSDIFTNAVNNSNVHEAKSIKMLSNGDIELGE